MQDNVYCYEGTSVLKNKLNITDEKELKSLEEKMVNDKLKDIINESNNIKKPYNIYTSKYFRQIHKKMFENIYDFAGEYRNIDMGNDSFKFAEAQYVSRMMEVVFEEIEVDFVELEKYMEEGIDDETLKGRLSKDISKHMANLNVLHPFRDGNTRCIREYFREVAYYFGYDLDLNCVSDEEFLDAMKLSVVDESKLEEIIYRSLKKRNEKDI